MAVHIGAHWIEVEGDTVFTRPDGTFRLEDLKEFLGILEGVLAEHGRCFTISDFRNQVNFPAETRRYAIEWSKTHVVTGSVMFGTSLTARVTLTLMTKATALLTRRPVPLAAVATEDDARAWVAAQRAKFLKKD
jgi:hypothetical protein